VETPDDIWHMLDPIRVNVNKTNGLKAQLLCKNKKIICDGFLEKSSQIGEYRVYSHNNQRRIRDADAQNLIQQSKDVTMHSFPPTTYNNIATVLINTERNKGHKLWYEPESAQVIRESLHKA
jgi:predicted AlkP superfamily phosphohydrolase/phosphomutase